MEDSLYFLFFISVVILEFFNVLFVDGGDFKIIKIFFWFRYVKLKFYVLVLCFCFVVGIYDIMIIYDIYNF